MKPTVGRIVHYQSYGTPGGEYLPEPRAAIVTEVKAFFDIHKMAAESGREFVTKVGPDGARTYWADGVELDLATLPVEYNVSVAVVNPTGLFFKENLPYAAAPTPGHWNWPPRGDS